MPENAAIWVLCVVIMGVTVISMRAIGRRIDRVVADLPRGNDLDTTDPVLKDLAQRIESVERRMETLHEESLRYLKKGSSALQRAKRLSADVEEEEEEEATPEEVEALQEQLNLAPTVASQPAVPNNAARPNLAHKLRRKGLMAHG